MFLPRAIIALTSFNVGSILYSSANCASDTCRQIDSGWVCGAVRDAEDGMQYISYRGIPYARQPVGELRFKELQPAEPWDEHLDATEEGPNCPQYDELYGRLVNPQKGMSEACIYANVHVPILARSNGTQMLPILVLIHGGGFYSGSGDSDLNGPEYLVSKGMIVITFNYRINVFGFFSMNNKQFPGNNALRDIRTFLLWVRRNAAAFGGDPHDVTLVGHSTGATCAQLILLSSATTTGLFRRVVLMSGTALPMFYSGAPSYSSSVAMIFLEALAINSTDPDYIHDQLVNMPLEKIMKGNRIVQLRTGIIPFEPVVEGSYPGVTRILDDDPIALVKQGRGKDIPMIIGFTSQECEFFRNRLMYKGFINAIEENSFLLLPSGLQQLVSIEKGRQLGDRIMAKYFDGTPTLDEYIPCCSDTFLKYPAFKLAQWRAAMDGAPVYLYQFSFNSLYNVLKDALVLKYTGGGAHVEDLTFIFRTNSMLGDHKSFPPQNRDDLMKYMMTEFVADFIKCDKPICDEPSSWPPVNAELLSYQSLYEPVLIDSNVPATAVEYNMISFFDNIYMSARVSGFLFVMATVMAFIIFIQILCLIVLSRYTVDCLLQEPDVFLSARILHGYYTSDGPSPANCKTV